MVETPKVQNPYIEIYISAGRRMRIEPTELLDVYLAMMFLQNSFIVQKDAAEAQEPTND